MIKKIIISSLTSIFAFTALNSNSVVEARPRHNQGNNKNFNHERHERDRRFEQRRIIVPRPIYKKKPIFIRKVPKPIIIYRYPPTFFNIGTFYFYDFSNAALYAKRAKLKGRKCRVYNSNNRWAVELR